MAMSDDQFMFAKKLNGALKDQRSFYGLSTQRLPNWYLRLISNLVLLIDLDELHYITGIYEEDARRARIIAFTPSLVIEATASKIDGDEADVSAIAVARCAITSLVVDAEEGALSNASFPDWPGRLALTATYLGLSTAVTVPLDQLTSGNHATPVLNLLSSLRKDLTA